MLEHQKKAKEKTTRTIFRECLKQREFTGATIGKTLSFSKPTVNEALNYLESKNLIAGNSYTQGEVGRKTKIWAINKCPWLALSIELDAKTIKFALINLIGEVEYLVKTEHTLEESILDYLYASIKNYLDTITKNITEQIKSCFISIAGDVSFDRKTIVYATNMQLENISILPLEKMLGMPIFLENEANCGVLSEFYLSKNIANTSLYISISDQGVGGGYIVDGRLQKGANRKGGEIGHFTIDIDGKKCSCGNFGCLERYTSNQALLELLKENGFEYNNLEEVFEDYNNDYVIEKYCHYLGRGIRSLSAILDPHQIIIGGKISQYKNRIQNYIEREVFYNNNFMAKRVLIHYAKHGELSSLIGAGLLSFFPMIYDDDTYS